MLKVDIFMTAFVRLQTGQLFIVAIYTNMISIFWAASRQLNPAALCFRAWNRKGQLHNKQYLIEKQCKKIRNTGSEKET